MSKTNLADSIDAMKEKIRRYNENVCNLLADPQILAYILIHTMDEFSGWDMKDVIPLIGDVSVRDTCVDPGYTNLTKVRGESTVDLVPNEGEIRYDVRFSVRYGEEQIRILLNLEAQKTTNPVKLGYHIENRIQYYLARMISSQKNVEFVKDNYDDIKKVVSIWICMDAGIDEDGIIKYSLKPDVLYGKEMDYPDFNKSEAYIVRIRERADTEESKNVLIQMLEILLSKKKNREVKELLVKNHGMIMELPGTEQEVNRMCNLGEALYEDAKQEGIELGIEQGIEQGIERGIEQGIERGIERGIEQGLELKSKEIITNMYKKGMNISEIAELVGKDEEYVRKVLEL